MGSPRSATTGIFEHVFDILASAVLVTQFQDVVSGGYPRVQVERETPSRAAASGCVSPARARGIARVTGMPDSSKIEWMTPKASASFLTEDGSGTVRLR